ncbi:hypothetical protein BDV33DRAFT_198967 [Aspergillus novoparasiticus]|uniref:Uncharacterized protein n=1 Tax=Aspergillus novoparasiticus TaxID=986946 RepID=A0A5N6F8Q0_9EURO|nr:hypothetical protein BDV33DRAFT_198967 [Aspergillus novoparasiticus]
MPIKMSQSSKFRVLDLQRGTTREFRYGNKREVPADQPRSEQLPSQHSKGRRLQNQKSLDQPLESQGRKSQKSRRKESEGQHPRRRQPSRQSSLVGSSNSEPWTQDPKTDKYCKAFRKYVEDKKSGDGQQQPSSNEASQSASTKAPQTVPQTFKKTNKRGHYEEGSRQELDKRAKGRRRAVYCLISP